MKNALLHFHLLFCCHLIGPTQSLARGQTPKTCITAYEGNSDPGLAAGGRCVSAGMCDVFRPHRAFALTLHVAAISSCKYFVLFMSAKLGFVCMRVHTPWHTFESKALGPTLITMLLVKGIAFYVVRTCLQVFWMGAVWGKGMSVKLNVQYSNPSL